MNKSDQVQVPTTTFELYNKTVTIDFYEKLVTKGHAYNHIYINRETGNWPVSVTGATDMVDKSRQLLIWAEKLSRSYMTTELMVRMKLLKKLIKKNGHLTHDDALQLMFTEEFIIEACHIYQVKKEEGASIGDQVHKWIEEFTIGNNPPMPKDEKVLNGVSAFLQWFKENEVEIVHSEQIIYSKKYDYVGKFDVIIRTKIPGMGNKKFLCLGDYKTNNWSVDKKTGERVSKVYSSQRYQISGYKGAWEEEHGKDSLGPSFMFAFDKETGNFKVHTITDHEKDYPCFLATLTLKKRDKELSRGW